MGKMAAARERQTAAVLVALLQSVARLVGRLRLGQWDAARLVVKDTQDTLHGLALLLGDHRTSEADAGSRLAEHLAQRGYPIPAVEMLGQGSYTAFHAVMTLPFRESVDTSTIGQGLEILSDDELGRLQEEQSRPQFCNHSIHGDVRAELQVFRQTTDNRNKLVRRAADEGLTEVETARLSGLSRNTVRSILGKGAGAPELGRQGGEPSQSADFQAGA